VCVCENANVIPQFVSVCKAFPVRNSQGASVLGTGTARVWQQQW